MDFEKAMRDAARFVPPLDDSAPQIRLQYDLKTRRLPRNHPAWLG